MSKSKKKKIWIAIAIVVLLGGYVATHSEFIRSKAADLWPE